MPISPELTSRLTREFEWFHRHPETALQEVGTTAHIRALLQENGIELLDFPLKTGVVAIVRGAGEGPVVALRADIDALPIDEKTALPYCSENAGRMHACGHDFHTTALLGAAVLLAQRRARLDGTVKLLFQPAEEAAHGAEKVAATGILHDVSRIFGLHVAAMAEPGHIYIVKGPDSAAVDRFTVTLTGKGCHAAHPNMGADPIVAAAGLIQLFQTVVSRNVNPFDPAVVSVTHVQAGDTWNVIPAVARMEGTVRTLKPDTRRFIRDRLAEICAGARQSLGVEAAFEWAPGAPSTNNDPALIDFVRHTAESLGFAVSEGERSMGGEDFSVYQQTIPGAFFHIGVGGAYPGHNPKFQVDETVLPRAAELMAAVGERALGLGE